MQISIERQTYNATPHDPESGIQTEGWNHAHRRHVRALWGELGIIASRRGGASL